MFIDFHIETTIYGPKFMGDDGDVPLSCLIREERKMKPANHAMVMSVSGAKFSPPGRSFSSVFLQRKRDKRATANASFLKALALRPLRRRSPYHRCHQDFDKPLICCLIYYDNDNQQEQGRRLVWRPVKGCRFKFHCFFVKKIETWYLWYFVKRRTKFMLIFRWQAHDLRVKSAFRYSEMLILSSMG